MSNPRLATWKTTVFAHLQRFASWETIKTIKAVGCMKLFKASRKILGEVTCFLIPPASLKFARRPDGTEYIEFTSNFAVLSKAGLVMPTCPHANFRGSFILVHECCVCPQ